MEGGKQKREQRNRENRREVGKKVLVEMKTNELRGKKKEHRK
jgi:hypothetical protein